jgi:hypothetical protein
MKRSRLVLALLSILTAACASSAEPGAEVFGDESGGADLPSGATGLELEPWAYEYEEAGDYGGIGSLHAKGLDGKSNTPLHLRALRVDVESAGHLAAFSVEHQFDNDSDERLEGTFRFTLPPNAIVTGLAMEIDGQLMEGEILARDKAQKIYRDIVDSMRDPAILEWEQGRTFKLRVFPIEARASKRVVLRYIAPLSPDPQRPRGNYRVVYPTVAPEGQGLIDHLSIYVNDEARIDRRDFEARGDIRIPLATNAASPDFVVERRGDHDYYAARIRPDWDQMPAPPRRSGPLTRIIWLDSSRSSLESWGLAREAALGLVSGLEEQDAFLLVSADLFPSRHAPAPVHPGPASLTGLEDFLNSVEPDGASDFSAAINEIGAIIKEGGGDNYEVIYIGDATPTWGVLDRDQLSQRVEVNLGDTPLHALVVGKGGDPALMRHVVATQAGRVDQPAGPADLRRFSVFLKHADRIKSLHAIEVVGGPGLQPPPLQTLFEGREAYAYFALPKGHEAPTELSLRGQNHAGAYEQRVALGVARDGAHVSRLWAAARIEALQDEIGTREGAKEELIALSEELGVLSRHTALLVLESEEAYRLHQIERRKAREAEQARAAAANDPEVSGRDLESMGGSARLAPGDIQPGDPEIHIPAPEDARSVTAVFPFGETKLARWEPALGQWSLRFLIDASTAPGRYEVQIRIVHADGRVEMRKAGYTVDTSAPFMELTLIESSDEPGVFTVVATQELRDADAERSSDQIGENEPWIEDEDAPESLDARSVDAIMPDGQTLTLRWVAPGRFEKRWSPRRAPDWPVSIRLMATDRALNVRQMQVQLAAPAEVETDGAR